MATTQTDTARAHDVMCTSSAAASSLWLLLRLLWVTALAGATCAAAQPLQAAPRLQVLAVVPWHAETGLTPSLPSEANPQGPSALVRWRGIDWLLDTAGQRLVATNNGAAQPLPDGWWEDAVADGEALWLLARLPLRGDATAAHPLPGVVRWQPGRPASAFALASAHTASALLPSPTGGPPWVEFMHRDAVQLPEQSTPRLVRPKPPAPPRPIRPRLMLVGSGPERRVQLEGSDAPPVTLPASIRLIRDAGQVANAVWWVWDDSHGTRWFSTLPDRHAPVRSASSPKDPGAVHKAVCKGIGPWQQLRVAHVHRGKVRVVCPLAQGVVVVEVKP